LINDLLDFSKIEAGRMNLEASTFMVEELYEELRSSIAPLIEKKNQTLNFTCDGALPPLCADRMRIKQVFINLLSNANKFTPDGGQITISCRKAEPGLLLFQVADTGIGIQGKDQDIIFEEFRQVDGSMTREVPGTGLGLTISKRLIELHDGKIWVESVFGEGSTFFVLLPASCPSACPEADGSS
jgi:signal transduction histidine kinase